MQPAASEDLPRSQAQPCTMFSLAGKVAFVSGASSGIGMHAARLFAEAGAAVVVAARRVDRLRELVNRLREQGFEAAATCLDVEDSQSAARAIEDGIAQLGRGPDILLNNAGVLVSERFVEQTPQQFDSVVGTNLRGGFFLAQEFARHRISEGKTGSIINVCSTSALRASGMVSSYAASKAALMHLGRTMALELAGNGIRVNNLCPGNIRTDMQAELQDFEASMLRRTPLRRFGEVEDLSGALLLLASDAGRYMTGADLVVDGGQTLSWM